MKKILNVFLAGTIALGFASCDKNKTAQPENAAEGTTYAGMYISAEKSIATRTIAQGDLEGRDFEKTLSTLNLLSTGGDQSWNLGTQDEAGKFWETTSGSGSKTYKVSPWKTTPGDQTMALIINKGTTLTPNIGTASTQVYGSTGTAVADIAALSTDNAFVMTSDVVKKTIQDNKGEKAVKDDPGTNEDNNVFKFNLERVVAQGMVAKASGLTADTKDGKGTIELATLKYAAVNGAAKTYLFAKHAGDRTMTEADGKYNGFTSAIDGYTDFQAAKDATGANVKANLIRLGNLGDISHQGGYAAKDVAADASTAKTTRGIYFLENSVDKTEFDKATNKDFGFYRLAYAKIYAKFTPKEVYKWDGSKMVTITTLTESDGTFYKGETDKLLYDSKASAARSAIANGQKAYTYKEGKCAYRALWNRQMDTIGKLVVNADVRRNNIYLLSIKEFEGLGMPWDPSDPSDPNLPKPSDPDEPTTDPDDPDIEKSETYMRVEATVLPWNLVSRDVNLQ